MTNCLDAETIAAWMDGSLSERERLAAEAHTADCDRCLAIVAAVSKTAPPPRQSVRPSWLSARWLVPAGTAAVAMVAWVLVHEPTEPVRQVDTVAAPAGEAATTAARTPEPSREAAPSAGVGTVTGNPAAAKRGAIETRARRDSARSNELAKAREEAAKREQLERLARDGLVNPRSVTLPPASPPAPPAATPVATPQAAAARAPIDALVQRQFQSVTPALVVSSDPNVRWRIAGASVERSTDGGRTWTVQTTGTQVPLSSGASPAPGVCWIVGAAGTVLLTTDGETWRRIDFADPNAQLVTVSARDALSATVTTADGRTYRTDDGGKTWRVQESLTAAF